MSVPVISLMTDFGIKDGNVGVMKSVIWRFCPQAQISDLSHMVAPQNVREAAFILERSAPYFPDGSVHVVVVDPGVGTTRRPMAASVGTQYYVGPDNGTVTLLLERAEQAGWQTQFVHLDRSQYWLPVVSNTFHGRDIFAPSAAHLAAGVPLAELGTPFSDPARLEFPRPVRTATGWRGEIVHIDHFGSAASNIRQEHLGPALANKDNVSVRVAGAEIQSMVNTFGERPPGELVALLGSTGNLIVAVVNGSAAARLALKVGDPFEVLIPA